MLKVRVAEWHPEDLAAGGGSQRLLAAFGLDG